MIENESIYKDVGIKTNSSSFKKWYKAGLLDEVDEAFASEVKEYWIDKTNREVDPYLHFVFMNLFGKKNPKIVSYAVMNYEVYPVLNDYSTASYYSDKNIYDLVIQPANTVLTVLRCIRGKYFDSSYNHIQPSEALEILVNTGKSMIIKPSRSNDGKGISKFKTYNNDLYIGEKTISINELLHEYKGDFIIQEMLEQHPNMAEPHPASVNTLRMVTLRWKNEIKYLLGYGRFGSGDDIRDNGDTDLNPRVGIKDNGEFFEIGLSQNGVKFTEHPTTGFKFSELKPIPNYNEFIQFVKDSHKNFLHLDMVSWDIAVGKDGKPVFIEANFAGPIPFYQLVAQRSMFGDLTEEVMEYVQEKIAKKEFKLMGKHQKKLTKRDRNITRKKLENNRKLVTELKEELERIKSKKPKNKNINNEISEIKREKQELLKELEMYKKEYKKIKQSNSWKLTTPLRYISSIFKKDKS